MSPMTTEEETRLRAAEGKLAGIEERCINRNTELITLRERVGKVETWKDKFVLLLIGTLLAGICNLAVGLVLLLNK